LRPAAALALRAEVIDHGQRPDPGKAILRGERREERGKEARGERGEDFEDLAMKTMAKLLQYCW